MTTQVTPVAQEATPPKRVNQHSRPVFRRKVTLGSSQAHRVMDRSFAPTAQALFSIDVILRIISEPNQVDEVESVVVGMIDAVSEDLNTAIAQFEKIMEDNGIDAAAIPEYDAPREFSVEITSPQISQMISLVLRLDRLISLIDTLWLNAVLNSKQRTDATFQWQQRLIRLAGRIIGFEKRARIAAHTKGKAAEVAESAPEVHTTDAEIIAEAESVADEQGTKGTKPAKTKKAA